MAETVNQETGAQGAQTAAGQETTFSQADVDRIVAERLSRERAKYGDYESLRDKAAKFDAAEEANKTELQKAKDQAAKLQAQIDQMKKADGERQAREKVAAELKVPASLLTASDEEGCRKQAQAILDFAKPAGYPAVQDGGEVHKASGGGKTRDQFADWFGQQLK